MLWDMLRVDGRRSQKVRNSSSIERERRDEEKADIDHNMCVDSHDILYLFRNIFTWMARWEIKEVD